ncbi:Histone H1 [Morus notabilis]|uniref:MYB transcription factor n=1 Tax=Morus notabilis TaxID=981085 RepID=W9QJT5_9ROSA|nr:Histone H1 [Morus notabilis]
MGNPKQKWTSEEEEALKAGVAKHGTGKWKDIQRDPEFNPYLLNRSNIDLKDKWRNMSCSANGQGPREKSRNSKAKANTDVPAAQPSAAQTATTVPAARDAAAAPNLDDSSKGASDGKNFSMYNQMIFEALSTLKEPNGLETSAIVSFIEQRHEVPQNFRRLLSTRLRRLVAQDKLEKIQNCYKMKSDADEKLQHKDASFGTKTPVPKVENKPRQFQNSTYRAPNDSVEEAAIAAAYKIAEAENKSFVAAEAVKEAERISEMAEETGSVLQLAKEIFEKCNS